MEKIKQNKHNGNFIPARAGLGQTGQAGRDGTRKSNGGRGRKQKGKQRRRKIFYNTEIIKQGKYSVVIKNRSCCFMF